MVVMKEKITTEKESSPLQWLEAAEGDKTTLQLQTLINSEEARGLKGKILAAFPEKKNFRLLLLKRDETVTGFCQYAVLPKEKEGRMLWVDYLGIENTVRSAGVILKLIKILRVIAEREGVRVIGWIPVSNQAKRISGKIADRQLLETYTIPIEKLNPEILVKINSESKDIS